MDTSPGPSPVPASKNPYVPPHDGRCAINQLPANVLSRIFVSGGPAYFFRNASTMYHEHNLGQRGGDSPQEVDDEDDEDEPLDFELLVACICRRWREVALLTPALWKGFVLYPGSSLTRLKMYLQRSQQVSMDVCINFGGQPLAPYRLGTHRMSVLVKKVHAYMDLVMPHMFRCRTFQVIVPEYPLLHAALVCFSDCPSAPALEAVKLYNHDFDDEFFHPPYAEDRFVLFHGNTPRLRQVSLYGVHLDWTERHFPKGLHELVLGCHPISTRPRYADLMHIFRNSPDLHFLTIIYSGPAGDWDEWFLSVAGENPQQSVNIFEPLPPLVLPALRTLEFTFSDYKLAAWLVERLQAPNLVTLDVHGPIGDSTMFLRELTRHAPATGATILTGLESLLMFSVGPCREPALIAAAYAAMVNLKLLKIHLSQGYVDKEWYDQLITASMDGTRTVILPRLETLDTSGVDSSRIRQLVELRKALGVPLRQVCMRVDDELDPDDRAWLQSNVERFKCYQLSTQYSATEYSGSEDMEEDA